MFEGQLKKKVKCFGLLDGIVIRIHRQNKKLGLNLEGKGELSEKLKEE